MSRLKRGKRSSRNGQTKLRRKQKQRASQQRRMKRAGRSRSSTSSVRYAAKKSSKRSLLSTAGTYNSSHKRKDHQRTPVVSVIIPVLNERKTIHRVVQEARRIHPYTEVIVVSNGTTDGSDRLAERAGANVLRYKQALGHDVGRKVGAEVARGSVLLFIDGDMVLAAKQLRPFVQAIQNGTDVALNQYSGPQQKRDVHPVVLAKYALNALLQHSELRGMSMTAVPHALSRSALHTIGVEHLATPPVAHAIALQKGLKVKACTYIPVGKLNTRRARSTAADPLKLVVNNDHMQAVRWLLENTDHRGGLTDLNRQRQQVR
ncbi:glycosyltransferase family 2 protein [Paenibacillus assamensis]|uniref:glycosyltransferase family 2 protein n=1 Tax=Paenibacillus assamensis TaxID=311244 RepID=UPI00040F9F4F|nr:glycosyltransferase [Paenibacillus assamensis]